MRACTCLFGFACALPTPKLHAHALLGGLRTGGPDKSGPHQDGPDHGLSFLRTAADYPPAVVEDVDDFEDIEDAADVEDVEDVRDVVVVPARALRTLQPDAPVLESPTDEMLLGQVVSAWGGDVETRVVLKKYLGKGEHGSVYTDGDRFAIKIARKNNNSIHDTSCFDLAHECAMLNLAAAAGVSIPKCYSHRELLEASLPRTADKQLKQHTQRTQSSAGGLEGAWDVMVMDMVAGKRLDSVTASEWDALGDQGRQRIMEALVNNTVRLLAGGVINMDAYPGLKK